MSLKGRRLPTKTATPAKASTSPGSGQEALSPTKPRPSLDSPARPGLGAFLSEQQGPAEGRFTIRGLRHRPTGHGRTVGGAGTAPGGWAGAGTCRCAFRGGAGGRDETGTGPLSRRVCQSQTPKAREALAGKLLDQAKQQAAGDAAGAFVLFRLARDLAVQAGDGATAFQAIDAMAEKFELDEVAMKTDVLTDLGQESPHAGGPPLDCPAGRGPDG